MECASGWLADCSRVFIRIPIARDDIYIIAFPRAAVAVNYPRDNDDDHWLRLGGERFYCEIDEHLRLYIIMYNAFENCGWSQVVVDVVFGSGGGTTNRVVVRETRGPDADNGRWNVVKPETHVHVIEG